jgi:nicotinamide riboside transporter PnuC
MYQPQHKQEEREEETSEQNGNGRIRSIIISLLGWVICYYFYFYDSNDRVLEIEDFLPATQFFLAVIDD